MDEFSGIRARTRPKRDETPSRAVTLLALALLLAPSSIALASDHAAPAEHAAPPAATEPPPALTGPVAAAEPRPRLRWLADPTTDRALGGYDPVAYFLVGRPTLGDPDRQIDWQGVTWLFQDEGTAEAFRAAPEVYAPLFAGRCAFSVSQGRAAEGSPLVHLIWRGHLLLFADTTARAAFLLAPDRLLAEARRRWPGLLADLP